MLTYILEVSICWGAFYLLYWLLLSRETFFHFNRWYLVSTFVLSFVIPKVEWQLPQPVAASEIATVYFQPITVGVENLEVTVTATKLSPSIGILDVLTWLYWLGAAFFTIRFLIGLIQITRFYHQSERQQCDSYELVLSNKSHAPFSFFNRLFLSKAMELNPEDQQNILRHELAHIHGGHSYDVLLLELASILFWCSPFVYLYRRSLRNVHEYIADAAVLRTTQRKQYGHLLIRQSQSGPAIAIANHFHSQLKKRILMMMRNPSKRQAMLKYLLVIPLTLLVLLVFSNADAKASLQQQAKEVQQHIQNAVTSINIASQEGTYSFKAEKGIFIDTIPYDGKPLVPMPEGVKYVIHYPDNSTMEVFSPKEVDEQVNPDQIERIEVKKDEKLVKIWLKGNYAKNANLEFEIHYSDGKTERTNDQQKVNQLIALDLVQLVEVNKVENLVKVNISKPKNLVPQVDQNWLSKSSVQIGGENTILFQHEVNGVPVNGKISSATYYNASELQEPPIFAGCEGETDVKLCQECSQKRMLEFIYKAIKYPKEAREQGIGGGVVVGFTIDANGYVKNAEILRGIGGGCDEEVLRLVNQMPRWKPGKKDGKAVSVQYTLPIKYKLEGEETPVSPISEPTEPDKQTTSSKLEEVTVVGYPSKKADKSASANEELFKVVEEMPRFPGCEEEAGDNDAKKACADKRMLEYIYQNVKYPKEAREKGVEGVVVVSFIIEKDGLVSTPKIMRDIGSGCGEEAVRIVKLMNEQGIRWIPGKQRGRDVRVQFNLPIRFKLDNTVKQETPQEAPANIDLPANTLELKEFKANPNPTNGMLHLSFKSEAKPTTVLITDISGKAIYNSMLKNFNGEYSDNIDLSSYAKGVLFLQIRQENKVYIEKIVLQ